MLYDPQDQQMKHAVLVCSRGIVFDPCHDNSLEDGEFIVGHFDRIAWSGDVSMRVLKSRGHKAQFQWARANVVKFRDCC